MSSRNLSVEKSGFFPGPLGRAFYDLSAVRRQVHSIGEHREGFRTELRGRTFSFSPQSFKARLLERIAEGWLTLTGSDTLDGTA